MNLGKGLALLLSLACVPSGSFASGPLSSPLSGSQPPLQSTADPFLPAVAATLSQSAAALEVARRQRLLADVSRRASQRSLSTGQNNYRSGKSQGLLGRALLVLGIFQVVQGFRGLAAARKAEALEARSQANATAMGMVATSGAGPLASPQEQRSLASEKFRFSPEDLKNEALIEAMAAIEEEFGIPGEKFAEQVANGADPVLLLQQAPQNALSEEEARRGYGAAKSALKADTEALLAESKEMPAATAKVQEAAPVVAAAKPIPPGRSLKEKLRARLAGPGSSESEEVQELSPEILAALAEREESKLRERFRELTLFEVVHRKYQEKQRAVSQEGIHGR